MVGCDLVADLAHEGAQEPLREVRQLAGGVLQVLAPGQVGHRDLEQVEGFDSAQGAGRGPARGGLDLVAVDRGVGQEAIHDLVEHAGVVRQELAQDAAPGREGAQEIEEVGGLGQELEHRRLGAEGR